MLTKEREEQIRAQVLLAQEYKSGNIVYRELKVLLEEIDRLRGELQISLTMTEALIKIKNELEILKNPSDGRCMEIGALRLHNAELQKEIEILGNAINDTIDRTKELLKQRDELLAENEIYHNTLRKIIDQAGPDEGRLIIKLCKETLIRIGKQEHEKDNL